jgi:replicative DNA helicase
MSAHDDYFGARREAQYAAERHRRADPLRSVADEMDEFVAWLTQFHGREFLGIPQYTLPTLDEMTWGLRGLILLAAAPNVGKTTIAVQWGLDAVVKNDDTAFLFVSLEMPRKTITTRLVANLAGLNFKTILRGSHSDGTFTEGELDRIEKAETKLRSLGERLFILDDASFPDPTLEKLFAHIDTVRARSGARRLYILVDYLNVWPITPEAAKLHRTDGDAEKWRIGQMKELRDYVGIEENAVVVISEAKKPQGSGTDKQWAGDLSDVMGSARGTYTPDIVAMLQNELLDDREIEANRRDGKAAQRLVLAKGRDGVDRGSIAVTHVFRESRYEEDR